MFVKTRAALDEKCTGIRKFLVSDWYTVFIFVLSCIFLFTGKEVWGTMVISTIIAITLVLTDDLMPGLQGIVLIACFAIRAKYSLPEFLRTWPLAIPIGICFFSHFFIYPKKLQKTSVFPGILATSIAVTVGGVGIIYWKTYFSPTSIFYMCFLGFGMLLIYMYMCCSLSPDRGYDFESKFCKMMISIIPMLCVCLAFEYFMRRAEFLSSMTVIPFQWRNNASTLLMLAMPFAFYFSVRKFAYSLVGLLAYIAIIFTGSRGGLLFGAAELAICVIAMIIVDRKHRKYYGIAIAVLCVAAIVMRHSIYETLSYTIQRLLDPNENSTRIEQIKRGIIDFKANPINGRGIAYMGNRDVHPSAKHTLCWYHCSLVQVPGSCGTVGILAFGYLVYLRIKCFKNNMSLFSLVLFISYIGLEMMSLVNPGIFVPVPYLFLVTIFFVCMEKCRTSGKEQLIALMKGNNK